MRELNGIIYYKPQDIAALCNKTSQTIVLWDKASNEREKEGQERYIPKPLIHNTQRLWTKEQVLKIIEFAKTFQKGMMADFNRKRIGKRGKEIQKRLDAKKEKIKELAEI